MKKVLIIAHSFPPSGIVGALRPFKFAKYLPDFGWKPIILSVKIGKLVWCSFAVPSVKIRKIVYSFGVNQSLVTENLTTGTNLREVAP